MPNRLRPGGGDAIGATITGLDHPSAAKAHSGSRGVIRRQFWQPGSVMPQHVPPDLLRVGTLGRHFVRHLSVMHHHDPVREFQDLVERKRLYSVSLAGIETKIRPCSTWIVASVHF
jgi:hypothetical protein